MATSFPRRNEAHIQRRRRSTEASHRAPATRARYPSLSDISEVHPDTELELVIELERPLCAPTRRIGLSTRHRSRQRRDWGVPTGKTRIPRACCWSVSIVITSACLKIDQIVIKPFDTLRTTWTSLLRSEVDMSTDVPPEALEFVQSDDIQTVSFPRNYQFLIAFNSRKPPFTSALVRRALNSAVDRNRLIASVLGNGGQPATGPLWPQHWAYDASVQPYGFDPRAAVSLLESAGFQPSAATGSLPPARLRFVCLLPDNFSLQERIGLGSAKTTVRRRRRHAV